MGGPATASLGRADWSVVVAEKAAHRRCETAAGGSKNCVLRKDDRRRETFAAESGCTVADPFSGGGSRPRRQVLVVLAASGDRSRCVVQLCPTAARNSALGYLFRRSRAFFAHSG